MLQIKRRYKDKIINNFFYFKRNVRGTRHSKNCLFSYSTLHFLKKSYKFHSNYLESRKIAELLGDAGYNVDVVNNNCSKKLNYKKYDLVIGEGLPVYNALQSRDIDVSQVIYFGTGSHPFQLQYASLGCMKRVPDYFAKHGLIGLRLNDIRWGMAATLANKHIIIGNSQTIATYKEWNREADVKSIRVSANGKRLKYEKSVGENYVFIGSYGLIHKGVDIVFEIARKNPHRVFYILGRTSEELFHITHPENVKMCGMLDPESFEFEQIILDCKAVLLPSVSEGTSTAVLTGMLSGGLLPIVTKECGISYPNKVEIPLRDISTWCSIDRLLNDRPIDRKEISDWTINNHSIANFKSDFSAALHYFL